MEKGQAKNGLAAAFAADLVEVVDPDADVAVYGNSNKEDLVYSVPETAPLTYLKHQINGNVAFHRF